MAIKASDLRQSADVKIGGDLVVGGDLAVPAGQTWRVNGNVKIEDGAALRIEDGATLALTGIATDLAAGSGQQRRRITVGDAVRYLAGGDSGQQLRAQIEQYELETEPTDAKRQNLERLRRAAFDAEPTDADRQRLERLKAEADRFMLVSPEEAERLRAQIDHPFLLSPDEAKRAAAQFTSIMAPIEGYAAELMRPPEAAAIMAGLAEYERPPRWLLQMEEYRSSWAEAIRKAVEPAVLNVALAANAAALESMHHALNPMAVNMMNDAIELMREPGKQVMAAMELMREPSKQAMAAINSMAWPQQTTIDAMSDLDRVRIALRNSGYSLGLLDDTDRAIARLYERRQAPPARRPEPPEERVQGLRLTQALALVEIERRQPEPEAERVQVVSLPAGDWQEALTHALTSGQASPADVGEFLYSLSVQQRQAGPVPPAWADIAAVAVMYRDNGHRYKNQGRFVEYLASKGMAIGLSTFKEWIKLYEQNTGVKVRPGQGSRKRKAIIG